MASFHFNDNFLATPFSEFIELSSYGQANWNLSRLSFKNGAPYCHYNEFYSYVFLLVANVNNELKIKVFEPLQLGNLTPS